MIYVNVVDMYEYTSITLFIDSSMYVTSLDTQVLTFITVVDVIGNMVYWYVAAMA